MMNKYIFFIFDNRSLMNALGILEHLKKYSSVEFVVSLENLASFIETLNIPNSKVILFQDKIHSLKNIRELIRHRRTLKDYYEEVFAKRGDYHIFFFDLSFELPLLYMIRKLGRRNTVYYYESFSYEKITSEAYSFKTILMKLLYKLIYSLDVCIYEYKTGKEKYFAAVRNMDLSKYGINRIDNNIDLEDQSVFKKYANKDPQLSKAKVLFLLTDYVSVGVISQSENDFFHGKLASLFSSYFARDEIIIKEHPSSASIANSFFKEYINVDSKIPAEFLFFSGQIKFVIGIASLSLRSAAKFENFLSVGLFRLFKSISADDKLRMQKNLDVSDIKVLGQLHFPESWSELEAILKSISERQ